MRELAIMQLTEIVYEVFVKMNTEIQDADKLKENIEQTVREIYA